MKKLVCCSWLLLVAILAQQAVAQSVDLRRAVPDDVFMVVHSQRNPEREFQREYYKEVWDTVQETKIIEQAIKIVTSRIPEGDLQEAKSVLDEVRAAAEPIDWDALVNCQESVYAQSMQFPTSQHLVLLRLTPDAAASAHEGLGNLFGLAEKFSDGRLPVESSEVESAKLTMLSLPPQAPFRPTVVLLNDVLLISTSEDMARTSLDMLMGKGGKSKFDDERLKEALAHLPEPEDSLVFYDARRQFGQMREMGQFIRQQAGGDPNAERIAGLIELLFDEVAIIDYEITVGYTENNQLRSAAVGKLAPGAQDKALTKVLGGGQPFEDWQRWVPADALAYSLNTGANLHPLYERIMEVVKEEIPEAEEGLAKFEQIQEQFDIHLDEDILQAFSGECVSITLPSSNGGQESVMAMRCQKPERIRELIHRGFDALAQIPFLQTQGLKIEESDDLEGFDEVSVAILGAFGVRPVMGFRDGWMFIGSNTSAVQRVLDTKAGKADTIAGTESFDQFGLTVEGPVSAIKYTNLAESTRQIAKTLNQVGAFLPMILGMVGAQQDAEELKPVQEVIALLPSVAKIVAKFDFMEAKLSVTQDGELPDTYLKRSAILVRPRSDG